MGTEPVHLTMLTFYTLTSDREIVCIPTFSRIVTVEGVDWGRGCNITILQNNSNLRITLFIAVEMM